MAKMLVELSQAHVEELNRRPESRSGAMYGDTAVSLLQRELTPGDPLLWGDNLSEFVLRCIGTALELEAHQARGGALLLEHPDGTLQELAIDLSQDGTRIPTGVIVTRTR